MSGGQPVQYDNTYDFSLVLISKTMLGLANNFQPKQAAGTRFSCGGFQVSQPASKADISSFIKRAKKLAASQGHHQDYRPKFEPMPFPHEATPLEIFALALAVFAVVSILGCAVMIVIKMRRSRAQHQFHSSPYPDDTRRRESNDLAEAFINCVKRQSNSVPDPDMNSLADLEENDATHLAPKHIFRPWREAVVGGERGIRELGSASSTGHWTEVPMDKVKTLPTGNQGDLISTFSKGSVLVGRRASRPFDEGDAGTASQNP
ncbi:hypothetical protein CI238_01002 [Colletotrichum incanum]|uniref:Uncharacterized protein n=1 Tax=Colletotrichum incanum TaxID=1573173 RepID=A0A166Q1D8_COLIC|nr:hypothetical protein CI238_01002 [Colletotrichum incanum]